MTQRLHLVFGGRVTDPQALDFAEPDKLDVVGIFPDAQQRVGVLTRRRR